LHGAFFNRSFYPDTAATGQLPTELCEGLVGTHGCRVSVVAGVPLLAACAREASELRRGEQLDFRDEAVVPAVSGDEREASAPGGGRDQRVGLAEALTGVLGQEPREALRNRIVDRDQPVCQEKTLDSLSLGGREAGFPEQLFPGHGGVGNPVAR